MGPIRGHANTVQSVIASPQTCVHFIVGINDDLATRHTHQTHRQWLSQVAAECLVSFTGVQAELQVVQLRLAHDSRESKQQPVVIGPRVIQPFGVGDERLE